MNKRNWAVNKRKLSLEERLYKLLPPSNQEWAEVDYLIQEAIEAVTDAERYRWFREQSSERKVVIAEYVGDDGHMLDHHIDKGMAGL